MHTVRRRIATALAASTLAIVGVTALSAAPAQAATCKTSAEKQFDTVGSNVWIKVQLCVEKVATNTHRAYAYVIWEGDDLHFGYRFEKFDLKLRLERNDADMDVYTCHAADAINNKATSSKWCGYATSYSTADGGWTADGSVTYNINNDGDGDQAPWSLPGTPKIS
ncbi:hypothetical protein WEI85_38945 [Actinomycetes bacterium KLBMP 9797]